MIRFLARLPLRIFYLIGFLLVFLYCFLLANYRLFIAIFTLPKSKITPGFVRYDIADLTSVEMLILSHCITLTPGTTSVEISKDHPTFLIHAFDVSNPHKVIHEIDYPLKKALLRFTRL